MMLIPLFPLEIVVFPDEELNLHIFEERYKQLIMDCQKDNILFGIPYFREGIPLEYGSTVRLVKIVNTYSDGRLDINTVGIRPIEVKRAVRAYKDKIYSGGYVEEKYWDRDGLPHLYSEIKTKIVELYDYMNITKMPLAFERDYITFEIAHKIGLNSQQEYELLQIPGEEQRQVYILDHLNKMIPMVMEMESMRKKIQLNGHFKNIVPPNI
jgi:ATP-dependent Lon protease